MTRSTALAISLWFVVLLALIYGVAQTASKIPALFG